MAGLRKGTWTEDEDARLRKCIEEYGEGKWHQVPQRAGLNRCRKSCRLRWLSYLSPNIKRGNFASDEVDLIVRLHNLLGNRWSLIAGRLPGRTANDIKNYWNTHLRKNHGAGCRQQAAGSSSQCKAQKTTSTVIKPRPRTFSKNVSWLRPKAANPHTLTLTNDRNLSTDSASKSQSTEDHDMQMWFDNLLNDKDIIGRGASGGSGEDDERIVSSRSEEETNLAVQKGCKGTEDWQNGFGDFCNDTDLWELLLSE